MSYSCSRLSWATSPLTIRPSAPQARSSSRAAARQSDRMGGRGIADSWRRGPRPKPGLAEVEVGDRGEAAEVAPRRLGQRAHGVAAGWPSSWASYERVGSQVADDGRAHTALDSHRDRPVVDGHGWWPVCGDPDDQLNRGRLQGEDLDRRTAPVADHSPKCAARPRCLTGPQRHVHPLALQHLLQGLGGLGDVVLGEEAGHVHLLLRPGERLDRVHHADDGGVRERGVGVVPVLAHEAPGLIARGRGWRCSGPGRRERSACAPPARPGTPGSAPSGPRPGSRPGRTGSGAAPEASWPSGSARRSARRVLGRRCAATTLTTAATTGGSTAAGLDQLLLEQLGRLGLGGRVVAEHRHRPDEQAAQLAGQVVLVRARPASRVRRDGARPARARTPGRPPAARRRADGRTSSSPATMVRQTATSVSAGEALRASWQKDVAGMVARPPPTAQVSSTSP